MVSQMRQQQQQQQQLNQSADIPASNEWSNSQLVQMKLDPFSSSLPVVGPENDRSDMGGSDMRMHETFVNSGEMPMDITNSNMVSAYPPPGIFNLNPSPPEKKTFFRLNYFKKNL